MDAIPLFIQLRIKRWNQTLKIASRFWHNDLSTLISCTFKQIGLRVRAKKNVDPLRKVEDDDDYDDYYN